MASSSSALASIRLALLLVGLSALLVELPGAAAKERPGYCVNLPVSPPHPSAKKSCSECNVDADCQNPKMKCCGDPRCNNKCQVPEPNRCRLPPVTGNCKARIKQFYYNWRSKRCEEFFYGGCLGNLNRFQTKEECERACQGKGQE